MKKKTRFAVSLLIINVILGLIPWQVLAQAPDKLEPVTVQFDMVEPGQTELTQKKVIYQTFDKNDDPREHISNEITANGDTYVLTAVSEPQVVKTEAVLPDVYETATDAFMKETADANLPEDVIERDGKQYRLVKKELVQTDAEEFTVHKKEFVTLTAEAKVSIREEKDFTFTDRASHRTAGATLQRTAIDEVASYWDDDFEFTIRVIDYNADSYMLGDREIPAGADLNDYKELFLSELGLDPEFYVVENVSWDGDPYEEDGHICRNAKATGKKYKKEFEITYEGDVTFPPINGYQWLASYEEIVPEETKTVYTMAADVTFGLKNPVQQDNRTFFQKLLDLLKGLIQLIYEGITEAFREHPVISSSVLALLAFGIIFLFLRKKKHVCIYDEKVKCPHKKVKKEICETCIYYHKRQQV